MKFKPGDLVIKSTGGNKMRILEYIDNDMVDCVWATDNIQEGVFNESELISISEYQSVITAEKRNDIINAIID